MHEKQNLKRLGVGRDLVGSTLMDLIRISPVYAGLDAYVGAL